MPSPNPQLGQLGKRLAAHLLRRANYNLSIARIDEFAAYTVDQAVNKLLNDPIDFYLSEPIHHLTETTFINNNRGLLDENENSGVRRQLTMNWWIDRALNDKSINSKMQFFLHASFITTDLKDDRMYFDHFKLLEFYALGSMKELAKKMTLDNVMLTYLNNTLNLKDSPNENYAREFLELFTIGKGEQAGPGDYTNYTEADIQEAAKLLTGFRSNNINNREEAGHIDQDTGIFRGRPVYNLHDTSDKTFSNRFANQTITGAVNATDMYRELDEFVEMIFNQIATARFIARKLHIHFVGSNITDEVQQDIINPLADVLYNNNYELQPALELLLKSQYFFGTDDGDLENNIIGAIIKSPLELWFHTVSFFELEVPSMQNAPNTHKKFFSSWVRNKYLAIAGQNLFRPSDVAGYPAYYQEPTFHREWFNSSSIIVRYSLAEMLLTGKKVIVSGNIAGGFKLDIVDWMLNNITTTPDDANHVVTTFLEYLLPEFPGQERYNYFLNDIFLDGLSPLSWKFDNWQPFVASNYQDKSFVEIPLMNLFKSIIYSPEYQLI